MDSHHDLLAMDDASMGSKSPTFAMDDSSAFFDYNQVSDTYPSFGGPFGLAHHTSTSPVMNYNSLNSLSLSGSGINDFMYAPMPTNPPFAATRPYTPVDGIHSITPSLTHLSPANLSASELSGDGLPSSRRSSTGSPASQHGSRSLPSTNGGIAPTAITPPPQSAGSHSRQNSVGSNASARYNPINTSTRPMRATRSKRAKTEESDDEDDADFQPSNLPSSDHRREEIRKQRIESEQRRRDELRDGYRRLKDALPSSNQKSSKVSLLDRAVTHIKYLEMTQGSLQQRLTAAENEMQRLRQVNEALMLGTAEQRHAAAVAAHNY
ncbi:hypothetical protein SISSUDRAFT_1062707 [Sistotremastrum suecicum HHB10207 ss-3]|uniref:BHLH domain-containing protein n=1 Tax=Sistotremastrum suecicum HHB10207 ss-3 TaxID=1314776 RepID=A0A166CM48_9AGAM|nr:hypothetical protein SISSUDRAFT_1062707 [Sistotremastrum suecicum HHB10207 ss-3]